MSITTVLHGRRSSRRVGTSATRLALEPLEARTLLDVGLPNILVNDPALDTTARDTQSETAIVLGAQSKVIVAFNDSVGMWAGDNYHGVGVYRSANGGATFENQTLPLDPHRDEGDPVLARSDKTGTIFLSTLSVDHVYVNPNPPPPLQWVGREQVDVFRSTNNGASFEPPANGTPGFDEPIDGQDKPWIAVDNIPGPDGSGYGNVYLVTRHYFRDASGVWKYALLLTRSTDDGVTFGPSRGTTIVSPRENTFHGPNVVVGSDHAVYVFWWDAGHATWGNNPGIMMRKSVDQGVTFGDPVVVTGLKSYAYGGDLWLTDSGGHQFQTNAFPQAAVNPLTGDIYVAYADWGNGSWNRKDMADIYFTQSSDGGQHWSKPVQINDDRTNNDQWFPALAVTPDGSHVGLFWYDRRLDPANNLIDRYGAIGTVSGHTVTFGANFRITDQSFPPAFTYWDSEVNGWHTQDPVIRPGYMGDYDQAVADNDYFYTTWGDNRLGDAFHANQPDVRLAKVPIDWQETETSWNVSALDAFYRDLARTTAHNKADEKIDLGRTLDLMLYDPLPVV